MAVKVNATTVVDNSGNVTPSGNFSATGNLTTSGTLTAASATINGALTATSSATALVYYNNNTISSNLSIPTNTNAMMSGPLTIANGVTVTINSGGALAVV